MSDIVISDPSPYQVRTAIKNIPNLEAQMFCKTLYALGLLSAELAGKVCIGEKAYGPSGIDVAVREYNITGINRKQVELVLKQKLTTEQAFAPVKIAVFTIGSAKKRLRRNEQPPVRNIALPLDRRYEPWTEEIYNYFQQAGDGQVFPYNRKHYDDYLRLYKIFSNFRYAGKPYTKYTRDGSRLKINPTPRRFKFEGLRKTRRRELKDFYNFTDFELDMFFGKWKYANFSEQYELYLPKLLK